MGCGNNNSLIIKKKLAATYGKKKELVHFKICELNFELVHVMNLVQQVDKKVALICAKSVICLRHYV